MLTWRLIKTLKAEMLKKLKNIQGRRFVLLTMAVKIAISSPVS